MSTQTSVPPWLVTWRTDPKRPTWTQFSLTIPHAPGEKPPRKTWQRYVEYATPRDAELAARRNGLDQLVPRADLEVSQ